MYITNLKFVSVLKDLKLYSTNEYVSYFNTIIKLIKKYGKVIFMDHFLNNIKISSDQIYQLIGILKKLGKKDVTSIKNILFLLKRQNDYKSSFIINSNSKQHFSKIDKFIGDSFSGATLSTLEDDNKQDSISSCGIELNGEGYFYKRNLEKDLKKMLEI